MVWRLALLIREQKLPRLVPAANVFGFFEKQQFRIIRCHCIHGVFKFGLFRPIFHQMTQIDNYSTGRSQINIFTSLHVGFISGYGTQMMEPLVGMHYCRAFSAGSAINANKS